MGVLRAKLKIIINDGPYEGETIEGTHNSKIIAFDDTSGKTVYNQGTGPLKGITINVKTINYGVTVEAQGTIIIID